jgi:CheY-like chemotaxis protein
MAAEHFQQPVGSVAVVDAEPALYELLVQWLEDHGWRVQRDASAPVDLVIVDLPFPREGHLGVLKRLAHELPGVPVLALSSNFFPGIEANGAVARALGVAATLPKPLSQTLLLGTIRKLLPEHV